MGDETKSILDKPPRSLRQRQSVISVSPVDAGQRCRAQVLVRPVVRDHALLAALAVDEIPAVVSMP